MATGNAGSSKHPTYFVWRRGDGYVSCTRQCPPSNSRDAFDVLLVTHEWAEARVRIEAEQDDRHRAAVASWED